MLRAFGCGFRAKSPDFLLTHEAAAFDLIDCNDRMSSYHGHRSIRYSLETFALNPYTLICIVVHWIQYLFCSPTAAILILLAAYDVSYFYKWRALVLEDIFDNMRKGETSSPRYGLCCLIPFRYTASYTRISR